MTVTLTTSQAALKALPPEYRAAVVLCDIEGFSYEEIAATLGVKLGTVRSRIHRGRAQLRAALEHRPAPVAAVNAKDADAAPRRSAPNDWSVKTTGEVFSEQVQKHHEVELAKQERQRPQWVCRIPDIDWNHP